MTAALAHSVGSQGQVYSYEVRQPMQELAQKNLRRLGLAKQVEFKVRDIEKGFDEKNVDALFLDLRTPHDYLPQVRAALKPGGHFSSLLPTFNQVEELLLALNQTNLLILMFAKFC